MHTECEIAMQYSVAVSCLWFIFVCICLFVLRNSFWVAKVNVVYSAFASVYLASVTDVDCHWQVKDDWIMVPIWWVSAVLILMPNTLSAANPSDMSSLCVIARPFVILWSSLKMLLWVPSTCCCVLYVYVVFCISHAFRFMLIQSSLVLVVSCMTIARPAVTHQLEDFYQSVFFYTLVTFRENIRFAPGLWGFSIVTEMWYFTALDNSSDGADAYDALTLLQLIAIIMQPSHWVAGYTTRACMYSILHTWWIAAYHVGCCVCIFQWVYPRMWY